jgi:hypothetical protein
MTRFLDRRIGRRASPGGRSDSSVEWREACRRAEPLPSRAVSIVVPIPAGGGTDYAARLISAPMGALLGQPVVVENRP